MLTRSTLAIAAAIIAGLAGVVATQDGDAQIVPFFIGLTLLAGVAAWAVHEPYEGRRRTVARTIGAVWLGAGGWIGALLLWEQALCGCSFPVRPPEQTYLGLAATVYHLAGVYLGGALVVVAAFSRRFETE